MTRRAHMRLLPLAASAALSIAIAGCGAAASAGKFSGPQRAVVKAIDDLSADAASHDAAQICKHDLAPALAAGITAGGGDCAKAVGRQLDDTDNFDVTVDKGAVTITGNTATARVKGTRSGKTRKETLKLVKDARGIWHVAGLG